MPPRVQSNRTVALCGIRYGAESDNIEKFLKDMGPVIEGLLPACLESSGIAKLMKDKTDTDTDERHRTATGVPQLQKRGRGCVTPSTERNSCFISKSELQATKFLSCSCVGLFVGVCGCACARIRIRVVACLFSTMHMCTLAVHEYLAFKQCK